MIRTYHPSKITATMTLEDGTVVHFSSDSNGCFLELRPDAAEREFARAHGLVGAPAKQLRAAMVIGHHWRPIEGAMARYHCACGARGLRSLETGEIRVARDDSPLDPRVQPVRPKADVHLGMEGCGQVGRIDPEHF